MAMGDPGKKNLKTWHDRHCTASKQRVQHFEEDHLVDAITIFKTCS
jgi:hypothetical protein